MKWNFLKDILVKMLSGIVYLCIVYLFLVIFYNWYMDVYILIVSFCVIKICNMWIYNVDIVYNYKDVCKFVNKFWDDNEYFLIF